MRKNFGQQTWLYPMPVFIIGTYDEQDIPDAMNAAWGGIWDTNQVAVCLSEDHQTTQNLLLQKAFTISMGTLPELQACDYVGMVSGKTVRDKVLRAGWHAEQAALVHAPVFRELPLALECRLVKVLAESGTVVGEIVNISADSLILDADGKIDPQRLEPLSYDPVHHTYHALGPVVGQAFSDGQKRMQ